MTSTPFFINCPRGNQDLKKGQIHKIEVHESDQIIIKCGGAQCIMYPAEVIIKQDAQGMYYHELILKPVNH